MSNVLKSVTFCRKVFRENYKKHIDKTWKTIYTYKHNKFANKIKLIKSLIFIKY